MKNSQKFWKAWDAAEASGEAQTVSLSGVKVRIEIRDGKAVFTSNGTPVSQDYLRQLLRED